MRTEKGIARLLCLVLIAALLLSGCGGGSETPEVTPAPMPAPSASMEPASTPTPTPAPEASGEPTPAPEASGEPTPAPAPTEPETVRTTCTISISCATILDHPEECDPDKWELVPADGWILPAVTVEFTAGESVFDILQRVCREEKIHMEYTDTPVYDSAYIEGIGNLYEMDVGQLSGWMYSVNGVFPNYGCSQYRLEDGDVICWVYTCDLGRDVGGGV